MIHCNLVQEREKKNNKNTKKKSSEGREFPSGLVK